MNTYIPTHTYTYTHAGCVSSTTHLMRRIQEKTGVKLTWESKQELEKSNSTFQIVVSDIKKIAATVKHMNVVSLAEGR
jgi:hypothetical protein